MPLRRAKARLAALALLLLASLAPGPAAAVELPPVGSPIFIQTNGPNADISLGDWYTSAANGIQGAYHYFSIVVPCRWPAATPFHIDLFSPEINTFAPPPRADEVESLPLDETIFELYASGTALSLPKSPGPGADGSLLARRFAPITGRAEQWVRFYTIAAPVACGSYLLRAETAGDEQNGWRLRIGSDDDNNPNTPPPAGYDNPDGRPGTGDEALIGVTQTTYQHNEQGGVQCLTLFQFVRAGLPEAAFHNFDLDGNERVTYYPPSATFDERGMATAGSIAGTVSANRVWNGGTQTSRGSGDVVTNPEPGWWRIVTCVRSDNQFNQEGQTGVPIFRQPVPEPDMVVAKDDGRSEAAPGDTLSYTISFTNQALQTKQAPGAAFDVTISDSLPANTSFVGCRLLTPGLAGRCEQRGPTVLFTLDEPVNAGDSGAVEVSVRVNDDAVDRVINLVALDYTDLIGNQFPTERAEDIDVIPGSPPPDVELTKTARLKLDGNLDGKAGPGDLIEYTLTATNSGAGPAFNPTLSDTPDPNTALVVGSVRAEPGGAVLTGNAPGDTSVVARFDRIAPGAAASVIFDVRVRTGIPDGVDEIVNQGLVQGPNVPPTPSDDPGDPEPGDPTEVPYQPPGPGPGTAIDLLDLRVERAARGLLVRWLTGAERDTAGFQLYRGTSADRAQAVLVTPGLIVARGGPAAGASYAWADEDAPAGPAYYWLVELEVGGGRHEYGPATLETPGLEDRFMLYLPQVRR